MSQKAKSQANLIDEHIKEAVQRSFEKERKEKEPEIHGFTNSFDITLYDKKMNMASKTEETLPDDAYSDIQKGSKSRL